jgi:glycosyltransferase involved in cell wall biosynthesis
MKVAFDHQIFSQQRYGGISRYFFELASRLPSETVSEVSVIAPLHINHYLAADSARRFTRGRYVPYTFSAIPYVVELVNRIAVPLAWTGKKPDIVHETFFATRPVGRARRRVVTVHDMIVELFAEEFDGAEHAIAAKQAAVHRADHIICVSERTRQDLVRLLGVDVERTSVVYHGYSMNAGMNAAMPAKNESGRSLLYVGNRAGYKNFRALLQGYASSPILKDFELIAFGGPRLTPDEQSELDRLGITDRVHFESGSDQKLAARYRAATAFVYPSKYEGFGFPPLEAMSHGCPVVCSDGGAIPEVVGDAGLYFDPNNVEDLRTALERVVSTEALRADLRTRGYARIKAFSWDECAAATARIYREVI